MPRQLFLPVQRQSFLTVHLLVLCPLLSPVGTKAGDIESRMTEWWTTRSIAAAVAMANSRGAREGMASLRTARFFIATHLILFRFTLGLSVRILAQRFANYESGDVALPLRA